jgi:hypothetical protein
MLNFAIKTSEQDWNRCMCSGKSTGGGRVSQYVRHVIAIGFKLQGAGKGGILIDVCYISVTENSSSLLQLRCKSKRWIADPRPARHTDSKIFTHFSITRSYGPTRNMYRVLASALLVLLVQKRSLGLDAGR